MQASRGELAQDDGIANRFENLVGKTFPVCDNFFHCCEPSRSRVQGDRRSGATAIRQFTVYSSLVAKAPKHMVRLSDSVVTLCPSDDRRAARHRASGAGAVDLRYLRREVPSSGTERCRNQDAGKFADRDRPFRGSTLWPQWLRPPPRRPTPRAVDAAPEVVPGWRQARRRRQGGAESQRERRRSPAGVCPSVRSVAPRPGSSADRRESRQQTRYPVHDKEKTERRSARSFRL